MDDSYPDYDFRVTVVDAAGREPALTDWGQKLSKGEVALLRRDVLKLG